VAIFLDHLRSRDIRRHQIGSELNAAELQREGLGERPDHQRLGQPRDAHEQAVPPGEQADQELLDDLLLADDHLP